MSKEIDNESADVAVDHHEAKRPRERDFTGEIVQSVSCHYVGTTGEEKLDDRLKILAEEIAEGSDQACLLAEMLVTAVRLTRGSTSRGDFKMMNRTLKEMRLANEIFYPYRQRRKVAVFGSARTAPDEPEYQAAVEFSQKMRELDWMTITGAGPGIMEAGNEGAGRDHSFGLNISLPFEASANAFINGDHKLIDFNYFYTRKLSFVKEADAAVGFPGGFGTMDEVFEALTLIQTGKATVYPIVLIDAKGGKYWKFWKQFIEEHLHRLGLISDTDFALFKVFDDIDKAIEDILNFYKIFHSYRYVGDKLVIRMQEELPQKKINKINKEFASIVKAGEIYQTTALPEEFGEPDLADLPRLVLRHKQRDFGKLRMLIDAINK